MDVVNIKLEIQGDSEGYVTFECPFCESEFKLKVSEYQNDEEDILELCCPYCGLIADTQEFYTKEVIEEAKARAYNAFVEKLNKSFTGMAKKINKNRFVDMKVKPLKKFNYKEIKEMDTVEEIFECSNCKKHEKILYCAGVSKAFCAYCGEWV
ncbi:MAG: hypothetical protein H9893_08145 [Candidatus Niameybacter stercoravium]|nr:hypothetical protein [Candidatus Niameybacter stercoravium]